MLCVIPDHFNTWGRVFANELSPSKTFSLSFPLVLREGQNLADQAFNCTIIDVCCKQNWESCTVNITSRWIFVDLESTCRNTSDALWGSWLTLTSLELDVQTSKTQNATLYLHFDHNWNVYLVLKLLIMLHIINSMLFNTWCMVWLCQHFGNFW